MRGIALIRDGALPLKCLRGREEAHRLFDVGADVLNAGRVRWVRWVSGQKGPDVSVDALAILLVLKWQPWRWRPGVRELPGGPEMRGVTGRRWPRQVVGERSQASCAERHKETAAGWSVVMRMEVFNGV